MPGGIHPPDSVIFSWPTAHYNDPVTRGWDTVAVTIVLGVLSITMVATRLIARAFVQHNFGIDDWVMIVAMIPTLGLAVGICLATQVYNFNRHIWDVRYEAYVPARKSQFANEMLYIWASGLIKISILLFYKRMTTGTFSKTFIYIIWACIAFVAGYIISFSFVLIFGCSPISANWLQVDLIWNSQNKYTCINEPASIIAASAIALVQDMIAATLPLALFWSLEIPKRQKFALIAVFLIGYFLVAANAVRMYYIYQTFYETYDVTWVAYEIWLWTAVEILVAPMCASAPALKVLFRTILQDRSWTQWSSRSRSRTSKGWRRTDGTNDEVQDQTDVRKSSEADSDQTDTRALVEDKKHIDSPTLGNDKSTQGVEMDYFKSVRTTRAQQEPQGTPSEVEESHGNVYRGSTAKVEKTLGL